MPPLTRELGMSVSEFTIAISVQNLTWGVLQPFAGALAVRLGYRPLMLLGSIIYVLGLALLATAQGMLGVVLGAGLLIGVALAATGSGVNGIILKDVLFTGLYMYFKNETSCFYSIK